MKLSATFKRAIVPTRRYGGKFYDKKFVPGPRRGGGRRRSMKPKWCR